MPQRNVRLGAFGLQRLEDFGGAIASIRGRFLDGAVASVFDASQLFKIRLVIVSPARSDFSVENDAALGVDRLMHFILELPRGSLLLSQCGIRVGTTAVGLVR